MAKKRGLALGDKDGIETMGMCYDKKKEEVPLFNSRKGDYVITAESGKGTNNNAWIVLGRDRLSDACSGYGGVGHSGAGAIDIVVGRMTPVPMSSMGKGAKKEKVFVDPMYSPVIASSLAGTKKKRDPLRSGSVLDASDMLERDDQNEDGVDDVLEDNPDMKHVQSCAENGIFFDAARIYISQKTDIDHYFGLAEAGAIPSPGRGIAPRSAIAMKADGIRVIAREGIKLVTMGNNGTPGMGTYNSNGKKINSVQGISLMAGNGKDQHGEPADVQPIVLGNELCVALADIAEQLSKLAGVVAKQGELNAKFETALMNHTHGETALGAVTLLSPSAMIGGAQAIIENISFIQTSLIGMQANLSTWSTSWVSAGEGGAGAGICSNWNTVN
jgi:hypothetical protein